MLRRRFRLRRSLRFSKLTGRILALAFGLALAWYGAMVVLLAAKVAPDDVHSVSGYRSVYDALAAIDRVEVDDTVRLVAGLAGLGCFVVFGFLAIGALPRPRISRPPKELESNGSGTTEVSPRAYERLAELAATRERAVAQARARFSDERLELGIDVGRAHAIARALSAAARRTRVELGDHGLPVPPIDVTVEGFDATTKRELR